MSLVLGTYTHTNILTYYVCHHICTSTCICACVCTYFHSTCIHFSLPDTFSHPEVLEVDIEECLEPRPLHLYHHLPSLQPGAVHLTQTGGSNGIAIKSLKHFTDGTTNLLFHNADGHVGFKGRHLVLTTPTPHHNSDYKFRGLKLKAQGSVLSVPGAPRVAPHTQEGGCHSAHCPRVSEGKQKQDGEGDGNGDGDVMALTRVENCCPALMNVGPSRSRFSFRYLANCLRLSFCFSTVIPPRYENFRPDSHACKVRVMESCMRDQDARVTVGESDHLP